MRGIAQGSRARASGAAAVGLLILVLAGTGNPQEISTENGLSTVTYEIPEGSITVNYPRGLVAGDRFTGTVTAEPAGTTDEEKAAFADRIGGYVVELNDSLKTGTGEGSFRGLIPAGLTALALVLKDSDGNVISRARAPLPEDLAAPGETAPGPEDFTLPEMGQVGHPVRVQGPFDGDFGSTAVAIGESDMDLLAESPRAAFFEAPGDRIGLQPIKVTENDVTVEGDFRTIGFIYDLPRTDLVKGEKTRLTTTVMGLEGIEEPVMLRLANMTPEIVTMEGGGVELITIEPEDVSPEGTFTFAREITGSRQGGFELTLDLITAGGDDPCGKIGAAIDSVKNEALEKELEADALDDEGEELAEIARMGENHGPSYWDEQAEAAEKEAQNASGDKKAELLGEAAKYRRAAEVLREYRSGDTEEQRLRAIRRMIQKKSDMKSKSQRLRRVAERLREIAKDLEAKHRECLEKMGAE